MKFKSINPYNNEELNTFKGLTDPEVNQRLEKADEAFAQWRKEPFQKRSERMEKVGDVLLEKKEVYAKTMSSEMGKPISEAYSEIEKCAWVCRYYAENAASFLEDETIETDAQKSFVQHHPIGAVFAIMPWNFPFWQVFRFAAPTLMAGNVALLKHAPNVFGCAEYIDEIFSKAGFPEGVFQNLIVHQDQTEQIISHDAVKAVTLTGSGKAGSAVASLAGKNIKKSLLELGGNNAFIVDEKTDLEETLSTAVKARMMNSGQSCIAAKRLLVHESVYGDFTEGLVNRVKNLKSGNPLHKDTQIGPLARTDLADQLQDQVKKSIEKGAKLLCGGKQKEAYHEPTVLTNVEPGMPVFDEETFGPVAAVVKVRNLDEAFELTAQSNFGLGVSLFTKDIKKALSYSDRVEDGAYFINELVKSDPRLPFGGTKNSGYGRELAKDGISEFINRKTVYVK